ncbi:hypothetical protein FACS1894216_14590 [Synergistales bacterium]|nr:hypothetical protein FACS1894216_14590 [Synergistales bacterium]
MIISKLMGDQINETMNEHLQSAGLAIENEFVKNADIAVSLAKTRK